MPLPKITTSEHELVLPSNGKTVKYRPFLVKEEKKLILALEGQNQKEITNAVKQVIKACVITKGVKIETLPAFDIEYLFLNIRGKSVGESIDLLVTCGDDGKTEVAVNVPINDISVITSEDHSTDIELSDGYTVKMKYPSLSQFVETNFTDDANSVEQSFDIIASCIDMVYNEKDMFSAADCTKKELMKFIEQLNSQQFALIENFFATMPKLQYKGTVHNPKTKKDSEVLIEGLSNFFA